MEFFLKLTTCLRRAGLSQQELADRSGISEAQISRWAGGKRTKVTYGDAYKLAVALDVSLYWLCDDSQGYPPPEGPGRPLGVIDLPPEAPPASNHADGGNLPVGKGPDAPARRSRKR